MKYLIVCLGFICLICVAYCTDDQCDWEAFKQKHNKTYATSQEEEHRKQVYLKNCAKISEHNKQADNGHHKHRLGHNTFSDLTEDEFKEKFLNLPPPEPITGRHGRLLPTDFPFSVPSSYVTSSGVFDYRTSAIPVKNQLQCGSCWAFSATGVFEYYLFKKTGKYSAFSEQMSVDCARSNGCNGGWMTDVFNYALTNGFDYQSVYPYRANANTCAYRSTTISTNGVTKTSVPQWHYVPNNERTMAYALEKVGWYSICLNANALQLYRSGIILSTSCSLVPNHAVILVGYGHDSASNKDYWIVRNSWGSGWGESGYFRLQRNVNACDVANSYAGYRVLLY